MLCATGSTAQPARGRGGPEPEKVWRRCLEGVCGNKQAPYVTLCVRFSKYALRTYKQQSTLEEQAIKREA